MAAPGRRTSTLRYRQSSVKDRFGALRRRLTEDDQLLLQLRVDRDWSWVEIYTSQLVDNMLQVSDKGVAVGWPERRVSIEWFTILKGIQPLLAAEPDPKIIAAVEAARNFLFLRDDKGNYIGYTPVYAQYRRNYSAWTDAVSEQAGAYAVAMADPIAGQAWPVQAAKYATKIKQALDDLNAMSRREVEDAINTLATVGEVAVKPLVALAQQMYEAFTIQLGGAVSVGIPWSYINPASWWDYRNKSFGVQRLEASTSSYESQKAHAGDHDLRIGVDHEQQTWALAWLLDHVAPVARRRSARCRETEPRGIRVVCDQGARFGAGLLVRDFRPGAQGLLLVSALHVLQGCKKVQPMIVGCSAETTRVLGSPWSGEHPVELLVWTAYDLVAVVLPAAEAAELAAQIQPARLAENVDDVKPPNATSVTLVAKSGINVCPRIPATTRDVVTVGALYDALGLPDYYRLFGSLSANAILVSYQSTAVEGSSGGPVLWTDAKRRALVAVHLGGQASVLQWGLLVGRKLLNDGLVAAGPVALTRLDASHPSVAASDFAAPLQLTEPSQELNAAADVALHRNALSLMVEGSTPLTSFSGASSSLQLGWTHLWTSLGLTVAFGTRLAVGSSVGMYRSPVFVDEARSEGAFHGTAKSPFFGGFGELDAELQLARLSPVNWVVGLGVRLGVSHLPHVAGKPIWKETPPSQE